MGADERFSRELDRLKELPSAVERGYQLQHLIADLFGASHFAVRVSPGTARPRQTDLLAVRSDEAFLVETKWRKDKAHSGDIDGLLTRMEAAPLGVVGVLVSHAGFTSEVIESVARHSSTPVLLISGRELDWIVSWEGDLIQLLRRKREHLLVHREVLLDRLERSRDRRKPRKIPASEHEFVVEQDRSRVISCAGGFGSFVFVRDLPDIDWYHSGGVGVQFDLAIGLGDERDLVAGIERLAAMGWASHRGRWSIQQSSMNWHGLGPHALVVALREWRQRYKGLPSDLVHHTEEVSYYDQCDGGFFTLTAQLSADPRRVVWRSSLSFQLEGVPLEPGLFRELCNAFNVDGPLHFRPRSEPSVRRDSIPQGDRTPLTVVGLVVGRLDRDDEEWVVGLVTRSPMNQRRRPQTAEHSWFPALLSDTELVVCDLASWHPVDAAKRTYRLRSIESAWTSDALITRFVADWDEPRGRGVRRPRSIALGEAASPSALGTTMGPF